MVGAVDKLHTPDLALSRVQDRLVPAVNELLAQPLLGGRLIDATLNPTGTVTRVAHGFGRSVKWVVVDTTNNVAVWRDATETRPELFLTLEQSGVSEVDVTLYVF